MPNLDEIPNADSSQHISDTLKLDKNNSITIDNLLQTTNTSSVEEANASLNDTYKDQEVEVFPLWNNAIIKTTQRPSQYVTKQSEKHSVDSNPNMQSVFNTVFNKLHNLYGVDIQTISDEELSTDEWKNVPEVQTANAFIYNGTIYINTDHAKADAPIHELTHLLLGSIRFKNPDMYFKIVQNAQNFPNFEEFQRQNPNRAMSDIQEEAFVTEMSKYLSGQKSVIEQLPEEYVHELHYNMKRLLDTAFMGDYSVKSIPDSKLYSMSLQDLASLLNSSLLEHTFTGSLDDAKIHRELSNVKEELMRSKDLREDCE